MRHSSANTARIYMHSEDDARHAAIQNINFNEMAAVEVVDKQSQEQNLSIRDKSKGIDGAKSFVRFLDALEQKVFKKSEVTFVPDRSSILTQFKHADKFGDHYMFKCAAK